MRITGKPIKFGLPLLAVGALVVVLALWAWGAPGVVVPVRLPTRV
jgi:hypothetical protein